MEDKKSYTKEIIAGIVTTVVGGIILALIPDARNFVAGIFDAFGIFFSTIWIFLISNSNMPWIMVLLLFFLSPSTLTKFVKRITTKPDAENTEPKLEDYKEDVIRGVLWKWNHLYSGNLSGFCLSCQTRLVLHIRGSYLDGYKTVFHCETCGKDRLTLDGERDFAYGSIWRQIERRVNTGSWKQSVISRDDSNY